MSSPEWFRNTDWNPEIEEHFFAKLTRARSQRDQYLVIQALTLAPRCPDVALRLIEMYFKTKTTDFDDMRALLAKAEAYEAKKDLTATISSYKAVLDREAEFPSHQSNSYVYLPYLIAKSSVSREYDFALSLLQKHSERLMFPIDYFRWHASMALILSERGLKEDAQNHAREAIKSANIRKSGFRYHQDLGLVGEEENRVVKKMYKLGA